jgi:pimeloyl-ACP methyl ester carboxylesterase
MPTVAVNGVETHYEAYGDGPPLVLLHGAGLDGRLWAEQARPLADEYGSSFRICGATGDPAAPIAAPTR